MTDIHECFNRENLEEGEIIAKTNSDAWVVGRRSDQREFYVILSNKTANLIEVNGECGFVHDTSLTPFCSLSLSLSTYFRGSPKVVGDTFCWHFFRRLKKHRITFVFVIHMINRR